MRTEVCSEAKAEASRVVFATFGNQRPAKGKRECFKDWRLEQLPGQPCGLWRGGGGGGRGPDTNVCRDWLVLLAPPFSPASMPDWLRAERGRGLLDSVLREMGPQSERLGPRDPADSGPHYTAGPGSWETVFQARRALRPMPPAQGGSAASRSLSACNRDLGPQESRWEARMETFCLSASALTLLLTPRQ